MFELAIGDRVKVIFSCWNKDKVEGQFGTIVSSGGLYYDWRVKVDFPGAPSETLGFNDDELERVEMDASGKYFDIA